ncbi:hypothetical protein L596_026189 [Steinernema carpocapsae]|uniref:Lysozyme n=1 Tax=Steinernema carpocapsae TaxID=34508 RepID=A0A4U5M0L8_STECR|nr:hypothetical protein L596_026189 [Steinernema carpocapsae]
MKLFVFLILVASSIAFEAPQDLQKANDAQQYIGYAVDLEQQASLANFQCLKNVRYTYAFVGVYNPYGNGSVYLHAASNLVNAWNAGLNIYPTLSPAPNSFKSGAQQFDEAYWNLYSHNLIVNTIWLKVSSPITWPNNPYRNVAFLSDILNAAARVNVAVGIYTNWNDWAQITGNWALTGRQLWYWNTNGVGHDASGSNDFTDFRSFAGFTEANGAMKQYTIGLQGCGVTFNRNRYVYTVAKEAPFGQGINFHQ